jgi:hypothetical protein
VTSLNDLEAKLDRQKWMRGKFIILAHVTDGGHTTLLREGFHQHYKKMHCVGGYWHTSFPVCLRASRSATTNSSGKESECLDGLTTSSKK